MIFIPVCQCEQDYLNPEMVCVSVCVVENTVLMGIVGGTEIGEDSWRE